MTITITDVAALGVLVTAVAQYFTLKNQVQVLNERLSALLEAFKASQLRADNHNKTTENHEARIRVLESRERLCADHHPDHL